MASENDNTVYDGNAAECLQLGGSLKRASWSRRRLRFLRDRRAYGMGSEGEGVGGFRVEVA